ncbi:50S ribosomal protein L2 [Candidatus Bandiella numerosa]|jgi:large subunit ribosomal protein L2|uniref:50S ribosomal protein L2 n=1 Tax=Candidatus Bandiella numerosa TaxID=2570586 RepID=UPI00249DDE1D|nr:50S ribosomal protein L2 [Candidatus Bandiella numerosa]WHA05318.1 50S ribosomal protein L2 [Candidatus Bandiella numerosa]
MALINYNPVTPSQRQLVLVDKSGLWKGAPIKGLVKGKNSSGGRNNLGRITVYGKSRGAKKKYRIIDFKRTKELSATVERFEYDPNRSANIALIKYDDNEYSYIIALENLKIGDKIISSNSAEIAIGNCMQLKNIPVGIVISNIELKPNKGAQLARSAGTSATIVNKDSGKVSIKLRSGEVRIVEGECKATIGTVSNADKKNVKLGKAGRKRWLGFRPKVRGVAKNPVDHPHGGGEGKTSGGRHPVSAWGKPTKGFKTRNNKRTDKFIIKSRHKKNK